MDSMDRIEAYKREVEKAWEDGILTPDEFVLLEKLRASIGITAEEDSKIQRAVREKIAAKMKVSAGPSAVEVGMDRDPERIYADMLEVALADGTITRDEEVMLEKLRDALGIDEWKHRKMKQDVLDKMIMLGAREDSVKKYTEAVEGVYADGVITSDETKFLESLRQSLNISHRRAKAIEFKVKEAFEREERKTPTHLVLNRYLGLGKEALSCRWFELAAKYFDKVLKLNSKLPEVWCDKATSLVKLGKYREAIECCKQSIRLKPEYRRARDLYVFCLGIMKQKIEKAQKEFA